MKLFLLLTFIGSMITTTIEAQSYNQSKLDFCKKEVGLLEKKVAKYRKLLDLQSEELIEVKTQMSEMKDEIKKLESENYELKAISVSLLDLALQFEKKEEYINAINIYKFLIKEYPTSLEAVSSRIRVDDMAEPEHAK